MDDEQRAEIATLVDASLDDAERVWRRHGKRLAKAAMDEAYTRADSVSSRIPGYKLISDRNEEVDTFIALVADLRGSSKHLLMAYSASKNGVSELQRVYYETSALLPALEKTIQYFDGSVTEYLGDGVLAFFKVEAGEESKTVKRAYRAAYNCINDTRTIVNEKLAERYRLPELDLGVGLGMSAAIVSLVGLPTGKHAKAIGRCVYNATKLSHGNNEIYVDEEMERNWPQSKGGMLSFHLVNRSGVRGFLVNKR